MIRILLNREDGEWIPGPSVEDVFELMRIMEGETVEQGPPEFELRATDDDNDTIIGELNFMQVYAHDDKKPPLWLISFGTYDGEVLDCLATEAPASERFIAGTCCGVYDMFRVECVLQRSNLVADAVAWFLQHGTPCPSMTWLDFEDAVRDYEGPDVDY